MERTALDRILTNVVSKAIESLAFAEVFESVQPLEFSKAENIHSVSIDIQEPFRGKIELHMRLSYLREIAEALYTKPMAEIGPKKLIDLLSELLNTMAGIFLSMVLADDVKFVLGLPTEIDPQAEPTSYGGQWHYTVNDDTTPSFSLCLSNDFYEKLERL